MVQPQGPHERDTFQPSQPRFQTRKKLPGLFLAGEATLQGTDVSHPYPALSEVLTHRFLRNNICRSSRPLWSEGAC